MKPCQLALLGAGGLIAGLAVYFMTKKPETAAAPAPLSTEMLLKLRAPAAPLSPTVKTGYAYLQGHPQSEAWNELGGWVEPVDQTDIL